MESGDSEPSPEPTPEPSPEPTPEEPGDGIDQDIEYIGNATGEFGSFYLTSGSGSVDQSTIENKLLISQGTLDGSLNNTKAASNATEGSAVTVSGTAKAGDTLYFSYAFATDDYLPYADYSFYSVNNKDYALGALGKNVGDYGSIQEDITYTFTKADFGGYSSGDYTIGFGVVDSADKVVDSFLQISEFFIDSSDSEEDEDDDNNEVIEEPNYEFEYYTYGNNWIFRFI